MGSNSENLASARTGRLSPWAIASLAILIPLGLLCIVQFQCYREPVYHGKALTVWLETYDPSSSSGRGSTGWVEADDAVRHIGTDSIPILLQMLGKTDSILKLRLIAQAKRQQLIRFHFVPAATQNVEASRAFIVLGDSARAAVPDLIKLYNEDVSAESQSAIEDALSWIGPGAKPAIPLLLRAATNSDNTRRANALWALGDIHAEPQFCVPVLIHALSDSDRTARGSAVHAHGMFGTNARSAVPALRKLAEISNTSNFAPFQERSEARQALRKINPDSEYQSVLNSFQFENPSADTPIPRH